MKKRIIILLLVFCCVLTSCNKDTDTTKTNSKIQNQQISSDENVFIDYSNHTDPNESMYRTILGDPSKLKNGEKFFATKESAGNWSGRVFDGFENKNEIWGYDVRSCDVSKEDLSRVTDFNDFSFNTDTVWPDKLMENFNPNEILESNKNPGLGIRALHKKGINGTGVGIAILDQQLLLDHEQYKDNLMYYEKIHCIGDGAQMHGPAVASIAVGKDIGVAPGSKLYYIAATNGHSSNENFDFDASIIADSILRVIEINKQLPKDEKIRVISISRGYTQNDKGYKEITNAIDKANNENIFVITTSTKPYYKFTLFGMNRDYLKNPDDFNSYLPAGWIEKNFYSSPELYQKNILVPMGSRTYAGCTGTSDYEIGHEGGLSWAVPWCAGFYALCCQVKPDITPQEFIDIITSTSVTTQINKDGKTYSFGKIINPSKVIEELQKK